MISREIDGAVAYMVVAYGFVKRYFIVVFKAECKLFIKHRVLDNYCCISGNFEKTI